MAFRRKKDQILPYGPDILVIQECENPSEKGDWSEFTDWKWIGENKHKGLGVFTRNGISIEAVTEIEGSRYVLAVETEELDVLAVWAMNDKSEPVKRYVGQVYSAITNYPTFLDDNTAVVGDFNWNLIWDESPKSPLCGDFSDTVEVLREHGLASSYHRISDDEFGAEASPTFYMHKKDSRPYHIDYAFLPEAMLASIEVSIGTYEDWIDASDHMPIVVDI